MPNGSDSVSYDLFLSYNSADHTLVEQIARKIRDEYLEPFLDRWYLVPGARWRPRLEQILGSCKAVAVFVGPGEMGRWQQREVDVALDLQANCPSFPVIPVLLPGCEPPLGFLRQLTWVDLRDQALALDQAIVILAKAARGEPPGPDLQRAFDSIRASVCPYRGLLHFREEDAPFFFGRQAAIDKLVDAVGRQLFVAVVGASGSGKSSVVRAGLVPRLRSDRHTAWETVILAPTDQPLKALARALIPLVEPTMDEIDRLVKATKLAEHFRLREVSLSDIVERILEKQSATDRVLIVVDQFEELYTLTADEEARRRFLDEILATSSRVGSKVNVVLTLRGDFVGKALAYRPLSDRLQDAQINLGPMIREELECAIRKPAEKIELEFEGGLVRRILNDVKDEPGNLPLLEFVLKELWDKRRGRILLNETYDAIGGLQGAVATKADEFLKGLSPAEQKTLQRVFLRIVRPSEGGLDTRRRAAFAELPPEGVDLVVKLANERLLVTNRSASGLEQTVEVAHEALISNWSTLRAWVNEDREFLLWRDRLGPLVAEWKRAQESDEALLRGPLLVEAQKWFDQRSQDLWDQERKFISTSREERDRLARDEKERQEREIEAAQRLARVEAERAEQAEKARQLEEEHAREAEKRAKEQKDSANKLRRRAFLAAGTAIVALILLAVSVLMWRAAQKEARIANAQTVAAESARSIATSRQLAAQGLNLLDGHLDLGVLLIVEALKVNRTFEARSALLTALLYNPQLITFLHAPADRIWSLAFSPDGGRLASSGDDGTIRFWDVAAGRPIAPVLRGHTGKVSSIAFSPDGKILASGGEDKTVRLWDTATLQRMGAPLTGHESGVTSVAFSTAGRVLASGSYDGSVRLWDPSSGQPLGEPLRYDGSLVRSLAFSSDGKTLASANDKKIIIWDVASHQRLGEPMGKNIDAVTGVAFSPNTELLASSAESTWLWSLKTRLPVTAEPLIEHLNVGYNAVAFSSDGKILGTHAPDPRSIALWDVATWKQIGASLRGHDAAVTALAFSPDGKILAVGSWENRIILWRTTCGPSLARRITAHEVQTESVAFSPDGKLLASGGLDGKIMLWNTETAQRIGEPLGSKIGGVNSLTFSPDGKILASGGDRSVLLWDVSTRTPLCDPLVGHRETVTDVAFSPDGKTLISSSLDGTIILWDVATRRSRGQTEIAGTDGIWDVVVSPDGKTIALAPNWDDVVVWNVVTAEVQRFVGHSNKVEHVAISPDGKILASSSTDESVILWDLETGHRLARLVGGRGSLAFSPDGSTLASCSRDLQAVVLWDVKAKQTLGMPLTGQFTAINKLAFRPDGKMLASGAADGSVFLWDVSFDSWLSRASRLANRNMTRTEWDEHQIGKTYLRTFPELPIPPE